MPVYLLDDEDVAVLRLMKLWMRNLKGDGVINRPDGATITQAIKNEKSGRGRLRNVLARITTVGTADGLFSGDLYTLVWDTTNETWTASSSGASFGSGAEFPELREINNVPICPEGAFVWVQMGIDDTGTVVPTFISPTTLHVVFPISLTKDGGSAGDSTTQCSFTYTVSDLDGNSLGTLVNPTSSPHTYKRTSVGAKIAATTGWACYIISAGAVTLSVRSILEVDDTAAC